MDINLTELESEASVPRRLTPAELRNYPGLENLSDEEAEKALETIYDLTAIIFEIHCYEESICVDNQLVVDLNQQKKAA